MVRILKKVKRHHMLRHSSNRGRTNRQTAQGVLARDFSRMGENFSPLRVLVVDDEPLIRWSVSETLSDCGHEVDEAADARSALASARGRGPFDVVVLDFRLPDSNDLELLSTLRSLMPKAQVILMTAFGSPEITQGALDLGAYSVVSKPFEVSDLASLIVEAHTSSSQS